MTPMQPRQHPQLSFAISVLQLFVLVVGVAGVFVTLGRKDAILDRQDRDISELRSIAQDLVKAQVLGAATDQKHGEALQAVAVRLDRLEARR